MKTKKILSLLIAMVMALGCVSLPAMAEESAVVAKIGDATYATLADAIANATAGDTITMLVDTTVTEDITLPAGITFNGNGKSITGNIVAGGNLTFEGHTKVSNFNAGYDKPTITIGEGACLELTGSGRMVIGHGATFNITGSITDAKNANTAEITPSLIMPGASFTGAGVNFNVKNAYIKTTASYCSSSKSASGTFDFNIENSIWEQYGKLAFEAQSTAATVNFDLKNSVLTTTSHLVFGVSKGEIVIDNSNVNIGTSNQIENQSTMTIKNGSVVNGAVATSSNAKNPGTIIVEDATYAVTGEFSGSDLGTGTLIIKNGATVAAGSITKANIVIDATGMTADETINFNANLSKFAGTVEVINNNALEAKIEDGKIVLVAKPVAYIGEIGYESVQAAIDAAKDGETVTITAGEYSAINISNKNITIEGTVGADGELLTTIKGGNPAIKGHSFNGTIKDIKIVDAWKVMYAEPAGNVTIDNVYVTGATYGFHLVAYSQGLTWTIENSYMDLSWANSFGVDGGYADIIIRGNEFVSTNPYYDGYGALHVNSYLPSVTVEENIFGKNARICIDDSVTDTSKINISKNYHADGVENAFASDSGVKTDIDSYYTGVDENGKLTGLVELPKGSNSLAYTKEVEGFVRIWGEGGGNAKESFVLKLYSEDTLMATTMLNNIGGIIDGNVYVTWNFFYPESNDEYWTTTWEAGHPNKLDKPTKVELYIDGTLVSTTAAQMNGADGVNPVVWEELGGVMAPELPNAEVTNLGVITVGNNTGDYQFDGSYFVYDLIGGSGLDNSTENFDLNIAMQFKSKDTPEEAEANAYANYTTDFFIKIDGLTNGNFVGDGCYLAGYYPDFGNWVKIPLDGFTVNEGQVYPVISSANFDFKYVDICTSVQDFICGIYLTPEILEANPNISVNLTLGLSENLEKAKNAEFVKVDDYTYTADDFKSVAKIGEKKYSSLEAAIEAAKAGDTITLLSDVELENAIVIEKDKNITLDLAGKTISGTCESSQAYLFMVNNGADLTIKDSSTEQTGKITFAQGASNVGWIIDVEGDLVLESGTLELTGESWSIGYAVDVRPNAWGTPYTEATTFTMNGGKIISSDGAVRVASSSADSYNNIVASFTMNGGEIDADWDGVFVQQSNDAWDVLKVTINGGTIKAALNPVRFYGPAATSYVNEEDCVDIALNGGTLTYTGTDESLVWLVDDILRLGGGVDAETFLKDSTVTASASFAQANVAEGYTWVESNGTYTLEKAAEVEKIKLISTNATLDNSLAINFIYAKSDIVGTDYVAKIKHTTATGIEEKEIPYTDWVANGAYIYVPYEGISAKQMGDRVEITICKEDGTAVSETDFESLENYAINFFNYYETASNMDLWKKAIADMLNYGAAAQTYFGYNTDKLVNGTAAENVNTYASTEVKYAGEYKSYGEGAFATSLNLEDTIELIAIFQGVTDNMTAKVEFVNHNGKSISYDAELKKNGAYHEVIVDKLVVADINQPVRVTVYNADGSEYAWIEDSINEYLGYIQQTEYADPLFEMASKFATSAYAALHAND